MKKTIGTVSAIGAAALILLSCANETTDSADSGADDLYAYQSEWTLPGTAPQAGFHLAATDPYLYVSIYRTGAPSLYWYQTNGTFAKDVLAQISTPAKKPTQPMGVAVASGYLYVADQDGEIRKIDPTNPENSSAVVVNYGSDYCFGLAVSGANYYATRAAADYTWQSVDRRNAGDGTADYSKSFVSTSDLQAVAVNSDGTFVYVADREQNKIYKYDALLTKITEWENKGTDSYASSPWDVAVGGPEGSVFVNNMSSIKVYDADGAYLGKFGSSGTGAGQFSSAIGVAVSPDGTVYVGDQQSGGSTASIRIQKFTKK